MFFKVLFQWAQICDKGGYQNSWRADFCINWNFRENFKEGGNGEFSHVLISKTTQLLTTGFQVYNIIMDFVFATFPWLITRKLEMRRAEKIGLCITMSLGMM
jgi:hypothetical protein